MGLASVPAVVKERAAPPHFHQSWWTARPSMVSVDNEKEVMGSFSLMIFELDPALFDEEPIIPNISAVTVRLRTTI